MSLINDALKRASETKKQTGDPPPPVTLNPVDYAVRPNPAFRLLIVLLLVVALAFMAWFLSKWQENAALAAKLQAAATNPPPVVVAAPTETPRTESRWKIKVSTNLVMRETPGTKPASRPAAIPIQGDAAATETPAPPPEGIVATNAAGNTEPTAPPAEATNTFPALKLQSIVFRLSKPAVVINGEMLYVGDKIKEVRIVKIDRFEVAVEWHGQTNTLSLPRL